MIVDALMKSHMSNSRLLKSFLSRFKSLAKVILSNNQEWVSNQACRTIPIEHCPIDNALDAGFIYDIRVYEDVVVWPGQSVASNGQGKIVETLFHKEKSREVDSFLTRWPVVPISSPCTSIDFLWSGQNHYHQMVDCHARLMALQQVAPIPDLKLLLPHSYAKKYIPLIQFICPWIEPIMVPKWLRYRCNTYIHLPPLSLPLMQGDVSGLGRFAGLSKQYFQLHKDFISQLPASKRKLVYISRKGATHRRVLNENDVVALIHQEGGSVVRLEHLNVEEQLSLFRDTTLIVSPHGAAMAGLLAASASTNYLELLPCKKENAPDYFGDIGTKCFHLFQLEGCEISIHDNFSVDIDALGAAVKRLLSGT